MTNQGEMEKNKLMNAEHNYDTDQNRVASTSRIHEKYLSKTQTSINLNIQQLLNSVTPTGNTGSKIMRITQNGLERGVIFVLIIPEDHTVLCLALAVEQQVTPSGHFWYNIFICCLIAAVRVYVHTTKDNSVLHSCSGKKKDCWWKMDCSLTRKDPFSASNTSMVASQSSIQSYYQNDKRRSFQPNGTTIFSLGLVPLRMPLSLRFFQCGCH